MRLQDGGKFSVRSFERRLLQVNARVIHQNGNRAGQLPGLLDQRGNLFQFCDVTRQCHRIFAECGAGFLQFVLAPAQNNHARAGRHKTFSDAKAKAGSASGNERGLAGEIKGGIFTDHQR